MKTKFYWVALLASAAMIAQANAGGYYGGGGGAGFAMAAHPVPVHATAPAFQSAPRGNFGGGRYIAPGARFSSYQAPTAFRQPRLVAADRTFARGRQLATGPTSRRCRLLQRGRLPLIGTIYGLHSRGSPGAVSATRLLPRRNRRHLRRGNPSRGCALSE